MDPNKVSHSGRRSGGAWMALAIWLIGLMGVVYFGWTWLPKLASEHGAGIDQMFQYLFITVGAMFVIGHVVLGYFVWRFSRQDRVSFRLPTFKSEMNWSLLPAVVMALIAEGGILILGFPVWGKVYGSQVPANAITVEVTAEQFAWNVRYPGKDGVFGRTDAKLITLDNSLGTDPTDPAGKDDVLLLNEIWVPVHVPLHLRLRSKDTIHSFSLPNFRFKQDVVPGMTMEFWFLPTETGSFEVACTELCGLGHYQMRALFRVTSREEYDQWLEELAPQQ